MMICVFLPGWVGDVVMATPALRSLRNRYPAARIIALGKPHLGDILEGTTLFDEYLPYNSGRWQHGSLAVGWRLRRENVDLAVLFSNSFRSAWTARVGGCSRRIGYGMHGRSFLLTDVVFSVRDESGRRVPLPALDSYNLLVRRAGCSGISHRMELGTTADDDEDSKRVFEGCGFPDKSDLVCLNPGGAYGAAKHWPTESFVEVARTLAVERGRPVLVLGGPSELGVSRAIASGVRSPLVRSLAEFVAPETPSGPSLGLGLIKALIRDSSLLITTDSGPRHIGSAFDRPVITLFGPTHIAWTETYHPKSIHLQKRVDCGPCQQRVCPLDHRCMTRLTPADVLAAVDQLDRNRSPLPLRSTTPERRIA